MERKKKIWIEIKHAAVSHNFKFVSTRVFYNLGNVPFFIDKHDD